MMNFKGSYYYDYFSVIDRTMEHIKPLPTSSA